MVKMFTIPANGGAPFGHNCPKRTMQLSTMAKIKVDFFLIFLFSGYLFNC